MIKSIREKFRGKKVLIFGLGLHGGGAGAASFFARLGAKVTVTDLKRRDELKPTLLSLKRFKNIFYVLGRHRKEDFLAADFIVKNPGVSDSSPFLKITGENHIPVLSDMEVFFKFCPALIVGITGTKGKSTTAHLLSEFLRNGKRRKIWLAGNIRKSVLEILPAIKKGDIVVLELSSFQLDSLALSKVSPGIAIITNIFPDHLNRYKNFKAYANSKAGIFRFQKKGDYLFLSKNDAFLKKLSARAKSKRIFVDMEKTLRLTNRIMVNKFFEHQRPSIALAIAAARHLGVKISSIKSDLLVSHQLSGRLEIVKTVGGIKFVNDTTATNPNAAIAALTSLHGKGNGGIILIAGGSDKKLPSLGFAKTIAKLAKAIVFLQGSATNKIKLQIKNLRSKIVIRDASTMNKAVRLAYSLALKGDTVLLSPGAASFGQFKHEFDRGEQFIKAVKTLLRKQKTR